MVYLKKISEKEQHLSVSEDLSINPLLQHLEIPDGNMAPFVKHYNCTELLTSAWPAITVHIKMNPGSINRLMCTTIIVVSIAFVWCLCILYTCDLLIRLLYIKRLYLFSHG